MVSDQLEITHSTVPTVPRHPAGLQAPRQHLDEHLLKIVVFSLTFRFIVQPVIDRLMMALRIGVIQRNQIDPFDDLVMLARPLIAP